MKLIVIAGWKTHDWQTKPDVIYWGQDGVEAQEAAKKAQQSGKYAEGAIKLKMITDWVPKPCVPTPAPDEPESTIAKTMKKTLSKAVALIALTAGLLFVAAPESKAQSYGFANLDLTGIGTTAGATTTTCTNLFIDVRNFQNVTLQTTFNFSGATTSNVVYTISKSIDKVNFDAGITWTNAGNGTTPVTATTTISTGGAGWLKLVSIQNTHATLVLTNTSFGYGIKVRAP